MTLTGSAGVGKTRLALAVGAELVAAFPGGVWFVELAGTSGAGSVGSGHAQGAGRGRDPDGGARRRSPRSSSPSGGRSLVILDNCEHLITECAEFVDTVLAASADVSILATSREQLGVAGEVAWRVPSLPSPPRDTMLVGRGAVAVRRRQPVRRPGPAGTAVVQRQRRQRGLDRADLPSAGRHPARRRVGRRPLPAPQHRPDRHRAGRPLPAADRRIADGDASPADAGGVGRVELRPARRAGATGAATPRRVRRTVLVGGRRGGRRRLSATSTRSPCSTRSAGSSTRASCSPTTPTPRRRTGCSRRSVRSPSTGPRDAGELTELRDAHCALVVRVARRLGVTGPTDDVIALGRRQPR